MAILVVFLWREGQNPLSERPRTYISHFRCSVCDNDLYHLKPRVTVKIAFVAGRKMCRT